jgi:hypothetical protein
LILGGEQRKTACVRNLQVPRKNSTNLGTFAIELGDKLQNPNTQSKPGKSGTIKQLRVWSAKSGHQSSQNTTVSSLVWVLRGTPNKLHLKWAVVVVVTVVTVLAVVTAVVTTVTSRDSGDSGDSDSGDVWQ